MPAHLIRSRETAAAQGADSGRHDSRRPQAGRPGARAPEREDARYRYGFCARILRPLIRERMDLLACTQAEIAGQLGVSVSTLSQYLNRHCLPPLDRLSAFERIGAESGELRQAILADRLQEWLDVHDASSRQAQQCALVIQAYEERRRALLGGPGHPAR